MPSKELDLRRLRNIITALEVVVEQAILLAETLPETGEGRRRFVKAKAMELLRAAEAEQNVFPAFAERLVFLAAEFAVDLIVDLTFNRLNKEGRVNQTEQIEPLST